MDQNLRNPSSKFRPRMISTTLKSVDERPTTKFVVSSKHANGNVIGPDNFRTLRGSSETVLLQVRLPLRTELSGEHSQVCQLSLNLQLTENNGKISISLTFRLLQRDNTSRKMGPPIRLVFMPSRSTFSCLIMAISSADCH
ncbi:unnamed protein product, partial [Nesidiocoris tenuis]